MNLRRLQSSGILLPILLIIPGLFALKGGYVQWVTGYLYLFIIQGYAAWLLFYKAGQQFYGYSATMALGAYTCVVLQRFLHLSPIVEVIIAAVLSMLLGVAFYLSISRSRGFYSGMASFLLAILIPKLIEALYPITGGRSGVQISSLNASMGTIKYFLLVVFLTAGVVFFTVWLSRTRIGKIWTLVSGNEDLTQAIGLNTFNFKLLAYAIAGLVSGFGGALYIHYTGSISSVDINVFTSVSIFFIPLLGSKRSIYGPVIGALFVVLFPELFSSIERYVEILYGLSYILVMVFLPDGIIEELGRLLKRLYYSLFPQKRTDRYVIE